MPRRYLPRRRLDDSAEQESASTGTIAPIVTIEPGDARLTEFLIAKGPQGGNGNGGAVPQTSVARLQRLAGNRAVADRLGGGGATIQRARNRASDEEEALPEPAQAGPVETVEATPESEAAPSAQAGPVEAAPGPESEAAPSTQAGQLPEAAAAPTAGEAAKAGILESAEKPAGIEDEPTGLDKLVQERVAPIVGEGGRVLPDAEIEAKPGSGAPESGRVLPDAEIEAKPGSGAPEGGRVLPDAEIEAKPGSGAPEGGRVLPDAEVEAKPGSGAPESGRVLPDAEVAGETGRVLPDAEVEAKPGSGAPEGGRVLPDAEVEAKPGPAGPEGGSNTSAEAPAPAGGSGPGAAAPGTEVPAAPALEPGGPDESGPSAEGPSPVSEPDQGEPLPAGDQAQISIMNVAGANAAVTAAKATAGADRLSGVAVSLAAAGFANALRLTMSRAVQWRSKILGFAPKVVTKAARMLTGLRMTASKMIQNIVLKVKSVADAAKGVIAWARQALGLARAAVRGIGNKLRSALGGAGEAVLKLLSSLLDPARKALGGLLKAGSEILLDGIKRVRADAASAVAFVAEEVGTRLETALAKVVDLVRAVVKAAREQARRAMAVIAEKIRLIRNQLLSLTLLARSMLSAARARASEGTSAALAAIAAAIANGYPQLRSGRGRRAFRRFAKMWRLGVRRMRRRARSQLASGMAGVKLFQGIGKAVVGGARAEARANYQATRTSLTNAETIVAIEAGELGISVGVAAALAAGAIDAAVTEGETIIREIAGEGDGDARELQGLINRVGK